MAGRGRRPSRTPRGEVSAGRMAEQEDSFGVQGILVGERLDVIECGGDVGEGLRPGSTTTSAVLDVPGVESAEGQGLGHRGGHVQSAVRPPEATVENHDDAPRALRLPELTDVMWGEAVGQAADLDASGGWRMPHVTDARSLRSKWLTHFINESSREIFISVSSMTGLNRVRRSGRMILRRRCPLFVLIHSTLLLFENLGAARADRWDPPSGRRIGVWPARRPERLRSWRRKGAGLIR